MRSMTSEKKKGFLESFREVWLPRRNRNAGPKVSPAEPVAATLSPSASENNKLVSESGIRKIKEAADKKRLEHELERERHMAIAPPSYNSQTNQAYAQSNSLANMGMSQAYIHSLMQSHGNGIPQVQYAIPNPPEDLVERVVSVEIDPTTDAGVYCITIADSGNSCSEFHISDAMLKTLHKKWLMARSRAEEDMGELNNSEEGESDVE